MRLLNAKTFKLQSFMAYDVPSYAILSHRWADSEVTFQDLQSEKGVEIAQANSKIAGCCRQAARNGYEYVWIDSCCIDKSSSAELSEAINSMFHWYQEALVCYIYLSDVPSDDKQLEPDGSFYKSAWFTRGWTLQELLAPEIAIFFDQAWHEIGTKSTLESKLADITKIQHLFDYSLASAAQKMSWVARRKTARPEDMAYCLMGIFGVNMPVLYGEGNNAFIRLQQEIIKTSSDESIFAWKQDSGGGSSGDMLAEHPSAFEGCGDVVQIWFRSDVAGLGENMNEYPYSVTNRGLQIQLHLLEVPGGRSNSAEFVAPLSCQLAGSNNRTIALILEKLSTTKSAFRRKGIHFSFAAGKKITVPRSLIYVRKERDFPMLSCNILIQASQLFQDGYQARYIDPKDEHAHSEFINPKDSPIEILQLRTSVWLQFQHLQDVFLLAVAAREKVGLHIWIPTPLQSFPTARQQYARPLDRAQKRLQSGKVVSAKLMKAPSKERVPNAKTYELELTLSD